MRRVAGVGRGVAFVIVWAVTGSVAAQEPASTDEAEEAASAEEAVPEGTPEDERGPTRIDSEADQRARQHFVVGRSYFEQARFEEAAREFEEAYRITGYPDLLINLAMARERALDYQGAVEAYERYLAEADETARWRKAADHRAARLREIHAERLDGASEGREATSGLSSRELWGYSVLGVGVAAAVAALVTMFKADDIHSELGNVCADFECPDGRGDDIDRGRRLAWASYAMIGAAVAAGATGLLLVLWGEDEPARETEPEPGAGAQPSVSFGVGRGGAAATVGWSF